MANQQSSKGPSLIGQTIGPTAPVVAGEDNSGLVKPLQIDASGNLKVAVTGAGSGGTSSVDEAAFTAGVSAGTPAMGVYEDAPTALADGQLGIVALDANRNVKVNIVAGSSGNAAASATGAAVPASADYVGFQNPAGNLEGFALESLDYDTDPASQPQTVIGIALPAAGGPVAGGTNTNPIQVGDAGGSLTVDGTVAVSGVSGNVTVVQGTATNLKSQAEVYQGGTAVGAAAPLQVSLANTGANATAVKVDGSAVTQPVSGTVTANLAAGTNNIGDVDVLTVPADPFGANADAASATGSISAKLKFIASTGIPVTSISAGTNYVGKVRLTDGTLDSSLVDETGTNAVDALAVGGGTPHDSVDSGNPIKIGWKAASALPTAVASADRANGISDLWGRQMVTHIDPAMQVWKSANYTSTQTGATIWDPTSGKKIAITSITIGTYGTTAARLILWIGANGDTTYTAGTDQLVFAGSYAPSSTSKPGTTLMFSTPVFVTTADYELHITTDAGISVDVAVYGYEW